MKNIVVIIALFFGFAATAQEQKNKNAKYSIEVNGNCDMCKKRIEKAAYSVDGVKSASWDVASHQLTLLLNETKSSLRDVETAIAKAGHDTPNRKATDEVYSSLHGCCQYQRD
ncbi:MAG: cation transporter [Flavobacterium sp.]|nr:cation transporter [Flavobacterium sp.]